MIDVLGEPNVLNNLDILGNAELSQLFRLLRKF